MKLFVQEKSFWNRLLQWKRPMWLMVGDTVDITFGEDEEEVVRLEGKKGERCVFTLGTLLLAGEREEQLRREVTKLHARVAHLEERRAYTDGWYE